MELHLPCDKLILVRKKIVIWYVYLLRLLGNFNPLSPGVVPIWKFVRTALLAGGTSFPG